MKLKINGFTQLKLLPGNHRNAIERKQIFLDTSETIIAPDHKYSFRNNDDSTFTTTINDFFDENGNFIFKSDRKITQGYLFEFIVPKGWIITELKRDDSKLDFFLLYSKTSSKQFLRYNFFQKKFSDVFLEGIIAKDVNNIFEEFVRAQFNTKNKNKVYSKIFAPGQLSNSVIQASKTIFKTDFVRKKYGSLLSNIIKGKINSNEQLTSALKIILNDPSFKLPKSPNNLFDHRNYPVKSNICEVLSKTYVGPHKSISKDTFRDIYKEKEEQRK